MTTFRPTKLIPTTFIPAKNAAVLAKYADETRRIADVRVIQKSDYNRNEFEDFRFSHGSFFHDWMKTDEYTMNPASLFGEMLCFYGFESQAVIEKCLLEFAKIDECEWARQMLATDSAERAEQVR